MNYTPNPAQLAAARAAIPALESALFRIESCVRVAESVMQAFELVEEIAEPLFAEHAPLARALLRGEIEASAADSERCEYFGMFERAEYCPLTAEGQLRFFLALFCIHTGTKSGQISGDEMTPSFSPPPPRASGFGVALGTN